MWVKSKQTDKETRHTHTHTHLTKVNVVVFYGVLCQPKQTFIWEPVGLVASMIEGGLLEISVPNGSSFDCIPAINSR